MTKAESLIGREKGGNLLPPLTDHKQLASRNSLFLSHCMQINMNNK